MNDYIDFIDMLEPLRLGYADIIYKDGQDIIFIETRSQALMVSMSDVSKFKEIYEKENLNQYQLMDIKQKEIVDLLVNEYQKVCQFSCFQEVYMKKEKLLSCHYDIRLLTHEDLIHVIQNYKGMDDIEYFKQRIACQHMWGLYECNHLAGFIGIHAEGSMGMLEVFPQYRRKGYGEALETFLINWYLEHDLVPYCQVVKGNHASLKLQSKLGLCCSQKESYWIF